MDAVKATGRKQLILAVDRDMRCAGDPGARRRLGRDGCHRCVRRHFGRGPRGRHPAHDHGWREHDDLAGGGCGMAARLAPDMPPSFRRCSCSMPPAAASPSFGSSNCSTRRCQRTRADLSGDDEILERRFVSRSFVEPRHPHSASLRIFQEICPVPEQSGMRFG